MQSARKQLSGNTFTEIQPRDKDRGSWQKCSRHSWILLDFSTSSSSSPVLFCTFTGPLLRGTAVEIQASRRLILAFKRGQRVVTDQPPLTQEVVDSAVMKQTNKLKALRLQHKSLFSPPYSPSQLKGGVRKRLFKKNCSPIYARHSLQKQFNGKNTL